MGQGTQTEEAGDSIDAEDEDYEKDAAIEDVVEEEPVDFADPDLNWKNFDDRCVIFSHVLYFTTLYWSNYTPKHDPKLQK